MAYCLGFHTFCYNLAIGCYIYTDFKRTSPVSAGWVSILSNVYSVNSSGMITAINACSNCPPNATFISSYCSGYDLYYTYSDGNCGTYGVIQEYNSTTCGYNAGTPYTCDCGSGCFGSFDPCYYYGCNDCEAQP